MSQRKRKAKAKAPKGTTEVFCRFIRKNGKIIYPKSGGVFHFWI